MKTTKTFEIEMIQSKPLSKSEKEKLSELIANNKANQNKVQK
jgi:hypothetical protein